MRQLLLLPCPACPPAVTVWLCDGKPSSEAVALLNGPVMASKSSFLGQPNDIHFIYFALFAYLCSLTLLSSSSAAAAAASSYRGRLVPSSLSWLEPTAGRTLLAAAAGALEASRTVIYCPAHSA